jgi:hypothetical protein
MVDETDEDNFLGNSKLYGALLVPIENTHGLFTVVQYMKTKFRPDLPDK